MKRNVTDHSSQNDSQSHPLRIAVVGSGNVGLVTAACFAEMGHTVISVDDDEDKIAELEHGNVPFYEHFLPELLQRHYPSKLSFTTSFRDAVAASAAIFIAIGTPVFENGEADLSCVEQAAEAIADSINEYKVIVEKSIVPVSTMIPLPPYCCAMAYDESCSMSFPIQSFCVRVRELPTFCIRTESLLEPKAKELSRSWNGSIGR